MIQRKSEEQLEARSFRARRKTLARRIARQTGRPVNWMSGRLVFSDTGKLASGHLVPKVT